mgnify:CR=1 FL=1
MVAIGANIVPKNIEVASRVIARAARSCRVRHSLIHLLDAQCREACAPGPVTIELPSVPGQGAVRRAAAIRGFFSAQNGEARKGGS